MRLASNVGGGVFYLTSYPRTSFFSTSSAEALAETSAATMNAIHRNDMKGSLPGTNVLCHITGFASQIQGPLGCWPRAARQAARWRLLESDQRAWAEFVRAAIVRINVRHYRSSYLRAVQAGMLPATPLRVDRWVPMQSVHTGALRADEVHDSPDARVIWHQQVREAR